MEYSDYKDLFEKAKKAKGKNTASGARPKVVSLYYAGFDPAFHRYTIYNGQQVVMKTKKSLRMGKKVCEDWASLLWSEKTDLSIPNKEKAIPYLIDIGFWRVGAKAVELAFALGLSCVAVTIDGELDESDPENVTIKKGTGRIGLEYYDGMNAVPLSYEGGDVSEIALFKTEGKATTMTAFVKNPETGKYVIAVVEERDGKKETKMTIETNSDAPMFACFHPNMVDNESGNYHGYPSILQNAIGTLQAIDNAFDGMDNEITLGKKRVFASAALNKIVFEKGEDGAVSKTERTFDPNDVIIYALPQTNATENDHPFLWSPNDPLRIDQYSTDITLALQLLAQQVGLGANYYRFENGRIMTATQVISQNSDTYRNVKKHEQVLEPAIKRLYRGIAAASALFTEGSPLQDAEDVAVIFDDSIIEDRAAEKDSDSKDLAAGIISKAEYRARWRGEPLDEAKKAIDGLCGDEEIVARFTALAPALASPYLTTKMACYLLFKGKEDLLREAGYASIDEYVAEAEEKKKSEQISPEDLLAMGDRSNDGAKPGKAENEPEPKKGDKGDE